MARSYADTVEVPAGYRLRDGVPSPEEFVQVREAAGLSRRSLDAAERGLPNTCYGVVARTDDGADVDAHPAGRAIGMARVVGDDGAVFHVCDVAVTPPHQGRGVGTALMDAVVAYLRAEAPETAYVNLLADVDGFYERWGFVATAPTSKGMVWTREQR